jgi:RHS repeat-associated protein
MPLVAVNRPTTGVPTSSATFAKLTLFVFLILATWSACYGQMSVPAPDVARPVAGVGHDYMKMLAETVNPSNGSLSIKIDLPTPKGRGLTIPYSVVYNSGAVHHIISTMPGVAHYSPGSLTEETQGGWGNTLPYVSASFWNVTANDQPYGQGTCLQSSNYVFYDPSGQSHLIGLSNTGYWQGSTSGTYVNPSYCFQIGFTNYMNGGDDEVHAHSFVNCNGNTGDGPEPLSCSAAYSPFIVSDENGTVYTFPYVMSASPQVGTPAITTFEYPYTIEDRNGNIVAINTTYGTTAPAFTDTLGNPLVQTTGTIAPGSSQTVTVGGLSYTLAYGTSTASFSQSLNVATVPATGVNCGTQPITVPNGTGGQGSVYDTGTPTVLTSILLPNGKQIKFQYTNSDTYKFGLVDEIDYPDGGWVKYSWDWNDTVSDFLQYAGVNGNGTSGTCYAGYKTPVIRTRTMGYTAGVTAQTQKFAYDTIPISGTNGSLWSTKTTTVKTTDNITNNFTYTVYTYSPVLAPNGGSSEVYAGQAPVETQIQYYAWNVTPPATPLQTVNKTWNDIFQMSSQQTQLDTGLTSEEVYCYQGTQILEEDEYDYGNTTAPAITEGNPQASRPPTPCGQGTPSRMTKNTYLAFLGAPILPVDPLYGQAPLGTPAPYDVTFLKPSQIVTYDGSGNRAAETDLYYDNSTSLTADGNAATSAPSGGVIAATHDGTYFSPGSSTARGNVTQLVKWANSGTSPTTTFTYDETGQVTSMIDPCGNASSGCGAMGLNHTTSYSYTDSPANANAKGPSNAYLTTVILPSVNGIAQQTAYTYNYTNGDLTSTTDSNDQITSYSYDSADRLNGTTYPDTGNTIISYSSPNVYPPTITTTVYASPNPNIVKVATYDGIGQITKTQVTSDPAGDNADTTYDGFGRVLSVSNSYNTTGDLTYGLTTFAYDALGRKLLQCQPDNVPASGACTGGTSYLQWAYTGNMTDIYDELRNHWQQWQDSFGRLTEVMEPNPALNGPILETNYSYDVLNNLKSVYQIGTSSETPRARNFSYNSLSQLNWSSNPESGQMNYQYDPNGNLTDKQDALGTSVYYSYDSLNRLTSKTYSDSTTPWVNYYYDSTTTGNHTIGRLSSSTVGGYNIYSKNFYTYDPMGRLASKTFDLPGWSGSGLQSATGTTATAYDQAGQVKSIDNGAGMIISINNRDGGGHPTNVSANVPTTSGATNGQNGVLYMSATYTPWGAPFYRQMGNGLTEQRQYDKRLRLTSTAQSQPGSTVKYSMTTGYDYAGNVTSTTDNVNGNWTYAYDHLNRLHTATSLPGFNLDWEYDSFGNRESQTNSGSAGGSQLSFTYNGNTNRADSGIQYYATGNIEDDAHGQVYTYDAEERITSMYTKGMSDVYAYEYDSEGKLVYEYGSISTREFVRNAAGEPLQILFYGAPATYPAFIDGDYLGYWYNGIFNWAGKNQVGTKNFLSAGTGNSGSSATPVSAGTYTSLPFGDDLSSIDNDPIHFTGKERDSESGLDYFGARYYSSNMGRFMSPDWSAKQEPVPYSKLDDPQTLNLYGYVRNNPLSRADPDGHCPWCLALAGGGVLAADTEGGAAAGSFFGPVGTVVGAAIGVGVGLYVMHEISSNSSSAPAAAPAAGSAKPEIVIDGNKHPESAQHAADAQAAGHPADVTIDRGGAAGRRTDALSGTPAVPGAHRDEYPPASTTQGGTGASVRTINPSDNSGAGASMGNQMRPYPDGTTVTIKPINVPKPPTP